MFLVYELGIYIPSNTSNRSDKLHILVLQECYKCLPDKTLSFLLTVRKNYDAKWVVKLDDDIFLAPERLPHALQQWDAVGADYIGCMKNGGVHGNDDDKWCAFSFEKIHALHARHA